MIRSSLIRSGSRHFFLAVCARFGFGKDFWINVFCTICGYFPGQYAMVQTTAVCSSGPAGHFHNFYIQNIRNNKNSRRTPKWAVRYGLIDDTALKRRQKRSQWAARYDERLPQSALVGQEYEEGQIPDRPEDTSRRAARSENELWNAREDEGFYGQDNASTASETGRAGGGGRWHYPANFDDAEPPTPVGKSRSKLGRKKDKKDRWARTEDAHAAPLPKKKRSKSSRASTGEGSYRSRDSDSAIHEGPEDAVGGLYGPSRTTSTPADVRREEENEALNHQF